MAAGPSGEDAGELTRLRRMAERSVISTEVRDEILDAGFLCHLGVVVDGWPRVLPTAYARDGGHLIVHGSAASRSLRSARAGARVCVTVTLLDALVLARSVFEHTMNYRCVIVYGVAEPLEGDARLAALERLSEHVVPGQWGYARRPSRTELAQTAVLRLPLERWSAKLRSGPPDDGDGPDATLGLWAGVVPVRTTALDPVADGVVPQLPGHLRTVVDQFADRLAPKQARGPLS